MSRLLCLITSSSYSGNKNICEGRTTILAQIAKEWLSKYSNRTLQLFFLRMMPFVHNDDGYSLRSNRGKRTEL